MNNNRRYTVIAGILLALILILLFTPLAPGTGGRYCGPEAFNLHRFVKDSVQIWNRDSGWETVSFGEACRIHDRCYWGNPAGRADCDQSLRLSLQSTCATGQHTLSRAYCTLVTRPFYQLVRAFGWLTYDYDDYQRGYKPKTNAIKRIS